MTIRAGTPADRQQLFEQALLFLGETPYPTIFGDGTDGILGTIDWLTGPGETEDLMLAESDGEVVGAVAMMLFRHPITGAATASELIWWVNPTVRASRVGLRLFRAAERWAEEHGAEVMQMGSWSPRLDAFYERLGYEQTERIYTKHLGASR